MPAPEDKLTPYRSRAIPSLAQHLREFASRPEAWTVLARNLIPVIGLYFFDWSAALIIFNYWFDGLSAFAAILAALIPRALRESRTPATAPIGVIGRIHYFGSGLFVWVFLLGILGLPYWIVLIPLHDLLLAPTLWKQILHSPALQFTFGSIAAGHLWKALRAGYDILPDQELKQRARWDVYLLVLRAIAMFVLAAHSLTLILVPLMSLFLTYLEVWPERALGAVFGDPARLYEYDPEKDRKKRR